MYNYCTLFDSNYLIRGLAMYESLLKNSSNFHLYILPFDDKSSSILEKLKLINVTIINLKNFETKELLKIKKERTLVEYYWTCTPSIIKYCFNKFKLDNCIYIDADIYFFSDPDILIEEMKNKAVSITEHRYSSNLNNSVLYGKYNVQFMVFKNNKNSLQVLEWWRKACNKWCYNRVEDGKFGDQKYLDCWVTKFRGVHEIQHLGAGVAPWNQDNYLIKEKNSKFVISEKKTLKEYPIIFYHFHGLKFPLRLIVKKFLQKRLLFNLSSRKYNKKYNWIADGFRIDKRFIKLIYKPYIKHLYSIKKNLNKVCGPKSELLKL